MSNAARQIAGRIARFAATTVTALAIIAGAGTLSRSAAAQEMWGQRAEIVAGLDNRYAEAPVALGLASNGGVIELFTAADGRTWTIVLTLPNGLSTIVANGESWTLLPLKAKGLTS